MTEYVPWYEAGQRIQQCLTCGSLVMEGQTELHTKWHDSLRDTLLALRGEIAEWKGEVG